QARRSSDNEVGTRNRNANLVRLGAILPGGVGSSDMGCNPVLKKEERRIRAACARRGSPTPPLRSPEGLPAGRRPGLHAHHRTALSSTSFSILPPDTQAELGGYWHRANQTTGRAASISTRPSAWTAPCG